MALLSRPLLCGNQATVSGEMWVTSRGMGSIRRPHRSHWAPLFAETTMTFARSTQPAARGWFRTHARSPDCCIFALFTVRMWFIFSWLELWGMAGAACPPLSPSLWAVLHSFVTLIHYAVKVILTFHRTLKERFTFLLIPLVSFLCAHPLTLTTNKPRQIQIDFLTRFQLTYYIRLHYLLFRLALRIYHVLLWSIADKTLRICWPSLYRWFNQQSRISPTCIENHLGTLHFTFK